MCGWAVWRDVAWCGVAWCGVAWRGVVRRGVAWCSVVQCGVPQSLPLRTTGADVEHLRDRCAVRGVCHREVTGTESFAAGMLLTEGALHVREPCATAGATYLCGSVAGN